jgi:hypothetical protein
MLARTAVHEVHVAAEVIVDELQGIKEPATAAAVQARAIANGHDKILGGGMVGPHAGREHWHGGGSDARQLHVFAAGAQVSESRVTQIAIKLVALSAIPTGLHGFLMKNTGP